MTKDTKPQQSEAEPMSEEARAYIDRVFPCEPHCDPLSSCDNCCEALVFTVGYKFGVTAGERSEKVMALLEAVKEVIRNSSDILAKKRCSEALAAFEGDE